MLLIATIIKSNLIKSSLMTYVCRRHSKQTVLNAMHHVIRNDKRRPVQCVRPEYLILLDQRTHQRDLCLSQWVVCCNVTQYIRIVLRFFLWCTHRNSFVKINCNPWREGHRKSPRTCGSEVSQTKKKSFLYIVVALYATNHRLALRHSLYY